MDRADLLGRILTVDNFDSYDDDGNKIFDGSKIVGMIADRSWFRIKRQDMFMDSFYNPNNRSIQYYLNLIKMYNFSLFANGVIFATEQPSVTITGLSYDEASVEVDDGDTLDVRVNVTPVTANTPTIVYTSGDSTVFTVEADSTDGRIATITGEGAGTATLTVTAGSVSTTLSVKVNA